MISIQLAVMLSSIVERDLRVCGMKSAVSIADNGLRVQVKVGKMWILDESLNG